MRRVGPALAMIAILAVGALPSHAGAPPRASQEGQPPAVHQADATTTFTLLPGTDASRWVPYTFQAGWAYTVTVTGTVGWQTPDSTPPTTCEYDLFWSNCYETGQPPHTTWQPADQAVYTVDASNPSQDQGLPGSPAATSRPALNSAHSYTWLIPSDTFSQTETRYWWAYPEGHAPTYTNTSYSGSLTVRIVAHPPAPAVCKAPWAARDVSSASRGRAHGAALNEVHVVCAQPDCQFHKGGLPADAWYPAETDTVLKAGDEVSCDPDGALTLAFADNSTVVVSHTTQLKIGSFFTEGGVVKTEILLKMGEIAAQVNKSEATKSDFRIKSPSEDDTRGARDASVAAALPTGVSVKPGGIVRVFYDPGTRTELVAVLRGRATLVPKNPRLPIVTLGAGHEVEFTHSHESPVARIGRAGARGGVDMLTARDRVLAVIAAHNRACQTITPRSSAYAIRPIRGGWSVAVKLIGALHGTSKWSVIGGKVKPANGIARTLARSCR